MNEITIRNLNPDDDGVRCTLSLFEARYKGKVIVAQSHEPILDACRILLGRGIKGELKVLGPQGEHRITCDIANAARLTAMGGRFTDYARTPKAKRRQDFCP